jgi:hypothetical protein
MNVDEHARMTVHGRVFVVRRCALERRPGLQRAADGDTVQNRPAGASEDFSSEFV